MKKRHLEVYDSLKFRQSLKHFNTLYSRTFKKLLLSKLAFNFKSDLETASSIDLLRVLKSLESNKSITKSIANIYNNTYYDAERRVSGSGIIAISAFLTLLPEFLKFRILSSQEDLDFLTSKINKDVSIILASSRRASSREILRSLRCLRPSKEIEDVIENALSIAGSTGNIDIEKTDDFFSSIERNDGYKFDVKLDLNFLRCVTQKEINISSPKVLIIDGIVEELNEIEGILRLAHKESRSLLIFARGFGEGVTSYLGANFNEKIIEVLPFTVNFDEFGANQLVDLAVCAGSDVVSSLKGDTAGSISWDMLTTFESALIEKSFIKIQNAGAQSRCVRQRQKLLNLLIECGNENEDVRALKTKIINRRINSMTPSNTLVKIGSRRKSLQGLFYDRTCKLIEVYNEMSRWGIISIDELDNRCSITKILQPLASAGLGTISPRMLDAGIRVAISNIFGALSVGAWIKNEAA